MENRPCATLAKVFASADTDIFEFDQPIASNIVLRMRIFLTVLCLIAGSGIAIAGPKHDETMSCEAAAAAQITPPMFYMRDGFGFWVDSATACGTKTFTIKNFHAVRDGHMKEIWCPKKCQCDPPRMADANRKKCGNGCRCP